LDPRWQQQNEVWNGSQYEIVGQPTDPLKGQRPIVAFVGGPIDITALQFVESRGQIVG
jgi:hypothetical protein